MNKPEKFSRTFIALLENSTDFLYFKDSDHRFTAASIAFANLTGHNHWTEMIGKCDQEVFPEKYAKLYYESDLAVMNTGIPLKNRREPYQTLEGELGWVDTHKWPMTDENGNTIGLFGISRDITALVKAEELLKKQTEQLHSLSTELNVIIDNIPGLVFYKDTNNRFIRVNKFMSDAHNLSKNELEGVSMFDIYSKEMAQAYLEDDLQVIESKKPKLNIDEPWETEAGLRWVNTSKIPNMDINGNVIGIIGISMDVTERKKQEEDLKEALATKDKIFSIIGHDLRSPFNHILGFTELLIENTKDFSDPKFASYLDIINLTANKTLTLLDNLLNWAKSETGRTYFHPDKMILLPIIREIFSLSNSIAQKKNIALNYFEPEEITVFADQNMIHTILRNLISNAIKFTNSDGKIDVNASQVDDNFVEIAVSDTGVGIGEEAQKKLFSLASNKLTYGTANEKGTGLGLILCKDFVEKHGGKIWVESELGKGSTFKFMLPSKKINE